MGRLHIAGKMTENIYSSILNPESSASARYINAHDNNRVVYEHPRNLKETLVRKSLIVNHTDVFLGAHD